MSCFEDYSRYYDLLYHDKDYQADADRVCALLARHAPGARSLCELGCGTGRLAVLLGQRGFAVHGVDLSDTMLGEAKRLKEQLEPEAAGLLQFSPGDVRSVRLPGTFEAVISLFHVMSYQQTNQDLLAAFGTAAAHLQPGGIFLFDFWYGPAVLAQRPEVRVRRCEDEGMRLMRIAEPVLRQEENLVEVHYQIVATDKATGVCEEMRETHVMRYLFLPELEFLLERSGFDTIDCAAWPSAVAPDESTWGVGVVARKR